MAASKKGIEAGRAVYRLLADDNEFRKGLDAARKRFESFGKTITKIGAGITAVGAGITAPFLVATKQFAETASALDDMSKQTGLSVETLSSLDYAAKQNGTTLETLTGSLFRMSRRIANVTTESGPAVRALAALGIEADALTQLPADEQMKVIADALVNVGDESLAAQYGFEIFGGEIKSLLPLLQQGSAGIEEWQGKAREAGAVIGQDAVDAAAEFSNALTDLKTSLTPVITAMATSAMPVLGDIARTLVPIILSIGDWIKENKELATTVFKVGLSMTAVGAVITKGGLAMVTAAKAAGTLATAVKALGAAAAIAGGPITIAATAAVAIGLAAKKAIPHLTGLNKEMERGAKLDAQIAEMQKRRREEEEKARAEAANGTGIKAEEVDLERQAIDEIKQRVKEQEESNRLREIALQELRDEGVLAKEVAETEEEILNKYKDQIKEQERLNAIREQAIAELKEEGVLKEEEAETEAQTIARLKDGILEQQRMNALREQATEELRKQGLLEEQQKEESKKSVAERLREMKERLRGQKELKGVEQQAIEQGQVKMAQVAGTTAQAHQLTQSVKGGDNVFDDSEIVRTLNEQLDELKGIRQGVERLDMTFG